MLTERKALPDGEKLRVENIGLKLTILQMQADNLIRARSEILTKTATELDCIGWQFDLQKNEFVAPEIPKALDVPAIPQ